MLSLNGLTDVQRLVRVLLADPLSAEAPWEQQLRSLEDTDERALLLRYVILRFRESHSNV